MGIHEIEHKWNEILCNDANWFLVRDFRECEFTNSPLVSIPYICMIAFLNKSQVKIRSYKQELPAFQNCDMRRILKMQLT